MKTKLNTPPSRKRMYIAAGASAFGATAAWLHWGGLLLALLSAAAIVLGVVAILAPRAYTPVYRVLDSLVQWFVQGISWLLLALVFVALFVPARVLLWVLQKHAIEPGPEPLLESYWKTPEPESSRHSFSRQF